MVHRANLPGKAEEKGAIMALLYKCGEVCGTCSYHYYDKEEESWVCDNPDSELFTDYTEYQDTCEEWEERE